MFILYSDTMGLPWHTSLVPKVQPRYSTVTKFKYYPILGEHNDWVIMNFIKKCIDEE